MRRIGLAVVVVVVVAGGAAPAETLDMDAVNAHCQAEWPDDFTMERYCRDKIADGHTDFLRLRDTARQRGDVDSAALAACVAEWRPDWAMAAYCTDKQINGVDRRDRILRDLPDDIATRIGAKCLAEWPDDHAMQAHCADRQAAAWRDLAD